MIKSVLAAGVLLSASVVPADSLAPAGTVPSSAGKPIRLVRTDAVQKGTSPTGMSHTGMSPINAGIKTQYTRTPNPVIETQVAFVDELLSFAKPVVVLHEVDEGPLFDPETQQIWMPDFFADSIKSYFADEDAPIADVYFHTLMLEVGHVLLD